MTATKEMEVRAHTTASDFIGTWKLVDYSFLHEDGTIEKPWGDQVVGYLLYSAEGYMSGNLSPAGRRHSIETGDGQKRSRSATTSLTRGLIPLRATRLLITLK